MGSFALIFEINDTTDKKTVSFSLIEAGIKTEKFFKFYRRAEGEIVLKDGLTCIEQITFLTPIKKTNENWGLSRDNIQTIMKLCNKRQLPLRLFATLNWVGGENLKEIYNNLKSNIESYFILARFISFLDSLLKNPQLTQLVLVYSLESNESQKADCSIYTRDLSF